MTEEQRPKASPATATDDIVYKTKVVHFLGRETPIVLQNDNGPCPLIAICNVLLLRNNLNLSLDVGEVSQQRLLALVAEKLIDCNSNVQDKDVEYVNNQQQNIADAIDLLPRLATGIDVNLRFTGINDFEFTRECATFDLFDIGIYHGWIIDPQDIDTALAIGSKSYNTLVAELVAFEARNSAKEDSGVQENDSVDFTAATTATLGVPSPTLSSVKSFDDQPAAVSGEQRRKGDIEEEEELMRVLNASRVEFSDTVGVSNSSESIDTSTDLSVRKNVQYADTEIIGTPEITCTSDKLLCNAPDDCNGNGLSNCSLGLHNSVSENNVTATSIALSEAGENFTDTGRIEAPHNVSTQETTADLPSVHTLENHEIPTDLNSLSHAGPDGLSTNVKFANKHTVSISEDVNPGGTEAMYEEEHVLESEASTNENQEPMSEGEVIVSEQTEKIGKCSNPANVKDEFTSQQWLLVKNFLEQNASQLTIYGLFCLQEGLKDRELCVFFRNNHFSTMFKFNGELYLLATDQGYINQPDLVWEKLNEVNGNTIYVTGNFVEFKAENQVGQTWNEQSVATSGDDYLASWKTSGQSSHFDSDRQMAMELQQLEYEQRRPQVQQHSQQNPKQQPVVRQSGLITGPQGARPSYTSRRNNSKDKDKCVVM